MGYFSSGHFAWASTSGKTVSTRPRPLHYRMKRLFMCVQYVCVIYIIHRRFDFSFQSYYFSSVTATLFSVHYRWRVLNAIYNRNANVFDGVRLIVLIDFDICQTQVVSPMFLTRSHYYDRTRSERMNYNLFYY